MAASTDDSWREFGLSRRRLLQVGGVGMVGLTLPRLLSARAARPPSTKQVGRARSCIFVVQYGGASHVDIWDPKPRRPTVSAGPTA